MGVVFMVKVLKFISLLFVFSVSAFQPAQPGTRRSVVVDPSEAVTLKEPVVPFMVTDKAQTALEQFQRNDFFSLDSILSAFSEDEKK